MRFLRDVAGFVNDPVLAQAVEGLPAVLSPKADIAVRLQVVSAVAVARLDPPPGLRCPPTEAGHLLRCAYAGNVAPDAVWRAELAKVFPPAPAPRLHANTAIAYALCPGDDATASAAFHGGMALLADASVRRTYVGPWEAARTLITTQYALALTTRITREQAP